MENKLNFNEIRHNSTKILIKVLLILTLSACSNSNSINVNTSNENSQITPVEIPAATDTPPYIFPRNSIYPPDGYDCLSQILYSKYNKMRNLFGADAEFTWTISRLWLVKGRSNAVHEYSCWNPDLTPDKYGAWGINVVVDFCLPDINLPEKYQNQSIEPSLRGEINSYLCQ